MSAPDRYLPPAENIVKGLLFALIAVPLGVVLWVVIWSFGFVSAIVAFAVAAAAAWLYRKGSGGRVSTKGAFLISGVVLVTLLLSFYAGLVTDFMRAAAEELGLSWIQALQHPFFWPIFNENFGAILNENLPNLIFALLFGVLGAFSVLRRAFTDTKREAKGISLVANDPVVPAPPTPQVNPGSSGVLNDGVGEQPEKV